MKTTNHRAGKRILCLMLCMALSGGAWAGAVDYTCPDCGKKISVFGESHIDEVAEEYGIPVLGRIPIQPEIAAKVDAGQVEYVEGNWLDEAAAKIQK